MKRLLLFLLLATAAGCSSAPKGPPPTPSQRDAADGARAFAQGDLVTAERRYRDALHQARAAGDGFQTAAALYNLSGCLLARGKAAEARVMLDQLDATRFPRAKLADLGLLNARVFLALDRLPDAEKALLDLQATPSVLVTLAELRLAQGNGAEAKAAALALPETLADRAELLGRSADLLGEPEAAAGLLQNGVDGYLRERRPRDAARTREHLAMAQAKLNQAGAAADSYLLAAQTWHGLGESDRAADALGKAVQLSSLTNDAGLRARVVGFATEMKDVLRALDAPPSTNPEPRR